YLPPPGRRVVQRAHALRGAADGVLVLDLGLEAPVALLHGAELTDDLRVVASEPAPPEKAAGTRGGGDLAGMRLGDVVEERVEGPVDAPEGFSRKRGGGVRDHAQAKRGLLRPTGDRDLD